MKYYIACAKDNVRFEQFRWPLSSFVTIGSCSLFAIECSLRLLWAFALYFCFAGSLFRGFPSFLADLMPVCA